MHEAVDLGLSVKWTIGERSPYERVDISTYGTRLKQNIALAGSIIIWYCSYNKKELTTYYTYSIYGCIESLSILGDSDNIAHIA